MNRPGAGATSRAASKATSGRSSPISSDFEDVGLDETRSSGLALGAGYSGVLVDSGDESRSSDTPELPVTSIASAPTAPSAASGSAAQAQDSQRTQRMQRGGQDLSAGKSPDDPVYSTLREIEDAGHKVADFAKAAASDVTKKLFGGGGGGAGAGPAAEDFSVSKLAAGVSSWWSALDPTQALQDAAASPGAVASPSKPEVQAFFGLPDSEELLEKFQCTLVQSYACTNNHFTTPRLLPYPGMLYITDRNSCFKSEVKETTLILPHTDVARANKVAAAHKDDSGGLKIFFGEEGHFVLFRAFKGPADSLDSALALVEHVTAAQSPTTE